MTRGRALAGERRTDAENDAAQLAFLRRYAGDPARYSAPAPHPDVRQAGITGSQHFLRLVAESRIDCRPWINHVEGTTVTFTDGTQLDVDAVIAGIGFKLSLPFLSDPIAATVGLDDSSITLSDFTFHPDLPGLAFIGLWSQLGPTRWCWNSRPATSPTRGVTPFRSRRRSICMRRFRSTGITTSTWRPISSRRWPSASAGWPGSIRQAFPIPS